MTLNNCAGVRREIYCAMTSRIHIRPSVVVVVMALGLIIFGGCAEKQAVVKDESVQSAPAATTSPAEPAATDDEAARKAREAKEAAAKRSAAAQAALNIQNIYFDFDKSTIRPDAREILKSNSEIFQQNSKSQIVIEGHCDERGTAEYNMALGERRAQEAKQYLINLGIDASRMQTISYGKEKPLDTRSTEEAWSINRRAQFVLQ